MFRTNSSIFYIPIFFAKKNVVNIVNSELDRVCQWLCTNKLSINLSKTNFMFLTKLKKYWWTAEDLTMHVITRKHVVSELLTDDGINRVLIIKFHNNKVILNK